MTDWVLMVHGGAGIIERDQMKPGEEAAFRAGIDRALDAGQAILAAGGASLDAVEAAVRVLEDDPLFNAGRGAVFTWDETNELDAAIMDGATRDAGAVAGTTVARNPVSLARRTMEDSPHVLLAGAGADRFAQEHGVAIASADWFATDHRRAALAHMKTNETSAFDVDLKFGTVGAVACDAHGHLAAATSTGGLTGKRWGRVGDTPLIGAGTWADDRACAVSATGSGEYFIRTGVGHEIAARVRYKGETLAEAADAVMAEVKAMGGSGGVIVAGPAGEAVWSFNSSGMYRGVARAGGRQVAIFGHD
jgi:L-asparaginase / beta-aspartyl-peptidase